MTKIKHPDFEKVLQLPDVEYFQSNDKHIFPLLKFYDWVIRSSNPMLDVLSLEGEISEYLKNLNISRIVITTEYEDKLKKVTKQFLMRRHRTYAKQAEREVSWHFLDVGPSTIEIEGLKKDQVCLLTGYIKQGNTYE
jgi:hypothetical protein